MKLLVGLTGGFGTGKSTAANLFRELGACVIDADAIVHEALLEGSPVYEQVRSLFPEASAVATSALDRKEIAKVVFADENKREKLEQIVHPFVFEQIGLRAHAAEEQIIVAEVPLLFETGFHRYCEKIIVVTATEAQATARLAERGYTPEEIEHRRKAQWPLEEKVKRADIIFDNSGTLEETKQRASQIWKELSSYLKGEE